MALKDLKSDLSWYSAKGIPAGYKPNADKQSTDFVYHDDLTVSATPKGFDNAGLQASFPPLLSGNQFQIDNNSKSFRGTATRMNQLGEGSKFPIGPQGQIHKFDLPRFGFNPVVKYEEVYGPLSNSGLADTYTKDSPIDDVYNKFKVRREAFNRGFILEPFILRGIQRNDNSDPQRFIGSNSPLDIPRGGILTATERAAIDVARMTQFFLTTKGLNFIAKQSTLALMNPNVEGADGEAQGAKEAIEAVHINSTKLFTPGNTLAQIGSAFTGLHFRKFGLTPENIQDTIQASPPMEYERILTETRKPEDQTLKNRLVLIYRDLIRDDDGVFNSGAINRKSAIPQLTAGLGPTALDFEGGVGETAIRRWSVTIPESTANIAIGDGTGIAGSSTFNDYMEKFNPNNYNAPYKDSIVFTENKFESPLSKFITDDRNGFQTGMLLSNPAGLLSNNYFFEGPLPTEGDVKVKSKFAGSFPEKGFPAHQGPTINIDYEKIQQANDLRKENKLVDFRSYNGVKKSHEGMTEFIKDSELQGTKGDAGRSEYLLTRLREDGKEGNRFDGIGDTQRAQSDNRPPGIDLRDPVTGKIISTKNTEVEYREIGGTAAETSFGVRTTDTDFREGPEGKYQPYKKKLGEEIGIAKQPELFESDGTFQAPYKPGPGQQAKNLKNDDNILRDYKLLAYDDFSTISEELSTTQNFIHYNRKKDGDKITFWDGVATTLDSKISEYNDQVEGVGGTDLITFSFNGIKFRAYIDTISDTFSPGFSPEPDQNRADPRYLYTSFERKVNLSFKVVYEKSVDDPWGKLKALADLSLPAYGGGPWAQRVDVTIGSLYRGTPMLIESISYDWDNETPWSLEGDQANTHNGLPMYTQVQLGLIYMGDVKAAAGSGYVAYG